MYFFCILYYHSDSYYAKKTSQEILKIISRTLFSEELKCKFRVSEKDFIRNRKLTFTNTLIFMLNFLRKSLVIEIHNFIEKLEKVSCSPVKLFTSSAYTQSRKKINPLVFSALSDTLVEEFYTDNELGVKLWKGFRLLAVDGSTLNLPFSKELSQKYGHARNQTGDTNVQARISVLYDVENQLVIDANINPRSTYERTMALKHLSKCNTNDLVIFDRGYFSYDFLKALGDTPFLMRLKSDLNPVKNFVQTKKTSQIVEINSCKYVYKKKGEKKPAPIKVRLIRVELSSGEIEVLATSLFNTKKYPPKLFKELYFKRWKVETFYDELKNKLKVELFTGYSQIAIQQDFYAAILVSNIQSIIVNDLKEEIASENKSRKYEYKVNNNLSYGFLKDRIITLLFSEKDTNKMTEELKILFKKHLVPIRSERTNSRNKIRRTVTKLKVTKNQRDAI